MAHYYVVAVVLCYLAVVSPCGCSMFSFSFFFHVLSWSFCLALRSPRWVRRASYFAFLWFIAYVLSVMVCLLFLLVSLLGYDLWSWLFIVIFYTFFFLIILKNLSKQSFVCRLLEMCCFVLLVFVLSVSRESCASCLLPFWVTFIWAKNLQNDMCAHRRLRSTLASTLSYQSIRCPHEESWGP